MSYLSAYFITICKFRLKKYYSTILLIQPIQTLSYDQ